jgi:DNA-binding response OmpR family regulator
LNRLLLLEDDPGLSKTLIKYLTLNGYEVDWAKNGEEAVNLSFENRYALYLFDINVPLLNGIDLLTELRSAGDMTPTIIISALVDVASVTKGFIAGADDYLKKPFDPEELLIRIKAKTSTLKQRVTIGNLEIDLETEEIFQDGKPLFPSEVQKKVLLSLVRNHPNPVTKEELLLFLEKPTDLALRVHISKLKKNLGVTIKSIRGVGYQII